jgi:hypothetical protein
VRSSVRAYALLLHRCLAMFSCMITTCRRNLLQAGAEPIHNFPTVLPSTPPFCFTRVAGGCVCVCCCFVLFRLTPNYSCAQLPAAIIQTQLKLSILFNCTPVASWVRAWSATEIAIVPSLPNTQNNVKHTFVEWNYRTGICKALVLDPSWEVSRAGREAPQGLAAKAVARFPYTPPGLPPWTKGGCFRAVVLNPDDPGGV